MSDDTNDTLIGGIANDALTDAANAGGDPGSPPDASPDAGKQQGENTLIADIANEGDQGAGNQQNMPDAMPPETPDGYKLTFAEGANVDPALLGEFQALAHQLGLPNEKAQSLVDFYAGRVAEISQKQQMAALNEAHGRWKKEITESPDFSGNRALIQGVMKRFGSKELTNILNETYLGSHPVFFKFMANVGKALAEPSFTGSGGQTPQTAAQLLYPSMR